MSKLLLDCSQEVRYPERMEKVTSTSLFLAMGPPEVKELKGVRTPRLKENGAIRRKRDGVLGMFSDLNGRSMTSFEGLKTEARNILECNDGL
jgi:hypothetical protein